MHEIEKVSLIQFQERNLNYRTDHIFFVWSDGCASSIGRIGGAQELHLNYYCAEKHAIIHEVCIIHKYINFPIVRGYNSARNLN